MGQRRCSRVAGRLGAGFKNATDFSGNRRNSVGSARTELKSHRILEFKFKNFKKNLKNYVKN
jgi:hypothetical protein